MLGSPKRNSVPTPRSYLSYSSLILFERSPDAWVRRYIYGETFTSPAMEFGSEIAEGLAAESTDNPAVEHLRTFLPSYPETEFPIEAKYRGVPLFGRLDQFDPNALDIGEVKTGRTPWTQARVDRHDQFDFYDLLVWLRYGRRARTLRLSWAPTEWSSGRPELTGEVRTFLTTRTLADLARIGARSREAWAGIQKVTKQELKLIA
jgi:hypothetical protein